MRLYGGCFKHSENRAAIADLIWEMASAAVPAALSVCKETGGSTYVRSTSKVLNPVTRTLPLLHSRQARHLPAAQTRRLSNSVPSHNSGHTAPMCFTQLPHSAHNNLHPTTKTSCCPTIKRPPACSVLAHQPRCSGMKHTHMTSSGASANLPTPCPLPVASPIALVMQCKATRCESHPSLSDCTKEHCSPKSTPLLYCYSLINPSGPQDLLIPTHVVAAPAAEPVVLCCCAPAAAAGPVPCPAM
jgi:hypothetical protein